MEIKKAENVNTEYAQNNDGTIQHNEQLNINNASSKTEKSAKPKKALKKWGIVGATLVVAGIVGVAAYVNYQNSMIMGGLQLPGIGQFEIQTFNSIFENHFGINRSYYEFESLVIQINAHNHNTTAVDTYGEIKIIADDIVTYNEENKSYSINDSIAKKTYFYTIEPLSYNDTGTFKEIKIEAYDRRQEE